MYMATYNGIKSWIAQAEWKKKGKNYCIYFLYTYTIVLIKGNDAILCYYIHGRQKVIRNDNAPLMYGMPIQPHTATWIPTMPHAHTGPTVKSLWAPKQVAY